MLVLETRSLFFARKLAEKKSTRFPKQTLDKSIFTARIEVFTHFSDYELGNETLLHFASQFNLCVKSKTKNTGCSKMKFTQKMAIKHPKYGFWTIYLTFLYSTHQKGLLGRLI